MRPETTGACGRKTKAAKTDLRGFDIRLSSSLRGSF
jgi:hypothetical protein